LASLHCDELYMTEVKDPDNLVELIQALQDLKFIDEWARPFSPEVLAALLRKNSFDVGKATDDLELATAIEPCPTSIPGQWQLHGRLTGWDPCGGPEMDPPEMEEFMDGLRDLGLKDKRGRPFCEEVLADTLRCQDHDPLAAADYLIIAADLIHGIPRYGNLEAKREAYGKLAKRFTGNYWYSDRRIPEPWHVAAGEPLRVLPEY
jgi:hypothetical protein